MMLTGMPFTRDMLFKRIMPTDRVLEIGPFTKPNLRGPNVRYFDVMDKAALIERAILHEYPHDEPMEIDFVSPTGDLSIITEQFDFVVSSHCIEHQADLVGHLQNVSRLLRPGGAYLVAIPDKRYCFDHFLDESTIDDVVTAHREKRKFHTLKSVLSNRIDTTHNSAPRHWAGDHGQTVRQTKPDADKPVIAEFEAKRGEYIDTHAWQFTPTSFANIIKALNAEGLCSLRCRKLYKTPKNTFEFCAILSKAA